MKYQHDYIYLRLILFTYVIFNFSPQTCSLLLFYRLYLNLNNPAMKSELEKNLGNELKI